MKYFALLYRLNAENRYLIWISNGKDFVAADAAGLVQTFENTASVQAYAELNHYSLESEEPVLHDLDSVVAWTKAPGVPVDCRNALAAWNLFADVARSIQGRGIAFDHLDAQSPSIYEKLFWGDNLPSISPKGRHYVPEWSPGELATLAEVLSAGLELFESCTRAFPQES
jgi:hypothetical protein